MDFLSRLFGSIPWAGDEVPPIGVMPDAPVALSPVATGMPSLPQSPLPESNPRADAIRADFEAIRNGQVQNVPPMAAVTSNPQLLAQDNRMNQLAQLRDTLASMNPQERKPEPVVPSESARTGMRSSDGYQRDRNTRLAILNEQERNRKPTTAGKDATINLDTLPEQLKQVYAQRAENAAKRDAMVLGSGLQPVARTEADKAAKRAEYESAGLAVPAVYQGMASPEKVRADKMRRAQEESYRQGNWSLMEQVRGLSQKLGINPLVATALVTDRMQTGPATDSSGEPRMPDSWEPRLRGGGTSDMTQNIMDAALLGQRGAALLRNTQSQNQGLNERAKLAADTQKAVAEGNNTAAMNQTIERGKQALALAAANGATQRDLSILSGEIQKTLQQMGLDAKAAQMTGQQRHERDMLTAQGAQAENQMRLNKELNPSLPLNVQTQGQSVQQLAQVVANMDPSHPAYPMMAAQLQQRQNDLQNSVNKAVGATPAAPTTQIRMPSPGIDPAAYSEFQSGVLGPNASKLIESEFNKGNLNTNMSFGLDSLYWSPWRTAAHQSEMISKLSRDYAISPEVASKLIDQWYARQYQGHTGLFSPSPSELPALRESVQHYGFSQPY